MPRWASSVTMADTWVISGDLKGKDKRSNLDNSGPLTGETQKRLEKALSEQLCRGQFQWKARGVSWSSTSEGSGMPPGGEI